MAMDNTYALLESCAVLGQARDAASLVTLRDCLAHPNWRVRYAAAVALGDRRDAAAVPALLAMLAGEDAAPLYTQRGDLASAPAGASMPVQLQVPPGVTEETLEAWRRRGRLKQAACLALGAIGAAALPALPVLQRYAVDQGEDYAVRAAACHALGQLGAPASLPVLHQAAQDGEWCTRTEARKALAAHPA
jgi:HEAT repeat protein